MDSEKVERSRRPVSAAVKRFPGLTTLRSTGTELNLFMIRMLTGQAEVWDSGSGEPSLQACPWRPHNP